MILSQNLNYPDLIVYQSTNNMGDQVLTFKYEGLDGSYPNTLNLSFPEGLWTDWTKENLLWLWNINNVTPSRMNFLKDPSFL